METDLFQKGEPSPVVIVAPLASRMRPTTLHEFVGQEHILKDGALLRRLIASDRLTSLILYGPPGTGKTSLAHVIAQRTRSHFERINAVSSGVGELRQHIDRAAARLTGTKRRTILFIDEIHRFNKAQQDVLLPHVESGRIIMIGTTVENPFFYLISPLLSRSHVFELKPLTDEDLKRIWQNVRTDPRRGFGGLTVDIEDDALRFLMTRSEGDARRFLNALDILVSSTPADESGAVCITRDDVEASLPTRTFRHDRGGDSHYDLASAFIKSMRGSDPDAALYWLARMLSAGEDPRFIARRIIICAAEDVGNADPQALVVACAAHTAAQCVGPPEAQIPLAQAALYVATAPKSNACYRGISKALHDVRTGANIDVPQHLRSSGFSGAELLGRGDGYQYPHDYQESYVHQEYAPGRKTYYQPGTAGHEAVIQRRMETLRNMKRTVKKNDTQK